MNKRIYEFKRNIGTVIMMGGGEPKYFEVTCPSATSSTTNPTMNELRSNLKRRANKRTRRS